MKEKLVKWGMIGTGNVTEKKSGPAFNKIAGSKLVAVGNRTPEKAEDYARRHRIERWHRDPVDVIRDPGVEIVYIATPPGSHLEYALASFKAGKPVYIEKPMALSYRECQVINEAAERAGLPVYIAYYRRSLEYFRKVKQVLADGMLGKILQINMLQYFPVREEDRDPVNPPWRVIPEISGGGYFHDVGCHALDIIFFMFGDPVHVTGRSLNSGGLYRADDSVGALITLPGNLILNGSWSFITPENFTKDRVEITGDKGRLSFSIFSFEAIQISVGEKEETISIAPPEHIQMPLIQSIVDEINGRGTCPSTGRTGAVTSLVMDQITGIRTPGNPDDSLPAKLS